jgi:hypothetical protein
MRGWKYFMRTMYKEEVERRKLSSVIAFFMLLVPLIYVSDFFDKMTIGNRVMGNITNPLLALITITIFGYAIVRCRTRYRYSIIADQLIIHKINSKEQSIVENIKIKDIETIDKKLHFRSKLQVRHTYNASFLKSWTCCCVYKQDDRCKKFYFQPSDNFINKLHCMIKEEKKKVS